MNFPYSFRLMACLPEHTPVELYRSAERLTPKKLRLFTAELSPEWTWWPEFRTPDRQCISSRPTFKRQGGAEAHKLHLSHGEKKVAGIIE